MNNIFLAFITGLTSGGISCLAVQGGLLTSAISQEEKEITRKLKFQKVGMFLVAKISAYTVLGFLLGLLGSTLVLSPTLLGWMQILAGIFMLGTAGRLLNLHPVFRYFQITPPKFAYRTIRSESKNKAYFAPAILGALTVLIPCGVTQAMMALAVASSSPFFGAGIMLAFTLGTSPVFFALGATALTLLKKRWFSFLAAGAIAILAIISMNSGQILRGSPHTLQNYWWALTDNGTPQKGVVAGVNAKGVQDVNITVKDFGYDSDTDSIKAGVPVRLTLTTNNTKGCSRAFTIPSLNISKVLPQTGTETIEFTPTKKGRLVYTCSMGMYSGVLNVI